jgi:hypothetical protein
MWIETKDGYVNSDHVVEISSDYAGEKSILHLVGGKTVVAQADPFELAPQLNPVIPANPGFEVLYVNDPGREPVFSREPIIAWSVSVQPENVVAITPCWSTLRSKDGVAILFPDGQVHSFSFGRVFDNVDEWVAADHRAMAIKAEQQKAKAI